MEYEVPEVGPEAGSSATSSPQQALPYASTPQPGTYNAIVNRTRQKLQIVKALKFMRKTYNKKHSEPQNKDEDRDLVYEDSRAKLRTLGEIKSEAKRKLAEKKNFKKQKPVEKPVRFMHYSEVLQIVGEMDAENKIAQDKDRKKRLARTASCDSQDPGAPHGLTLGVDIEAALGGGRGERGGPLSTGMFGRGLDTGLNTAGNLSFADIRDCEDGTDNAAAKRQPSRIGEGGQENDSGEEEDDDIFQVERGGLMKDIECAGSVNDSCTVDSDSFDVFGGTVTPILAEERRNNAAMLLNKAKSSSRPLSRVGSADNMTAQNKAPEAFEITTFTPNGPPSGIAELLKAGTQTATAARSRPHSAVEAARLQGTSMSPEMGGLVTPNQNRKGSVMGSGPRGSVMASRRGSTMGGSEPRRGSVMQGSVVDERARAMIAAKEAQEEAKRVALMQRLRKKDLRAHFNEKQLEQRERYQNVLRCMMSISRLGYLVRIVAYRRAKRLARIHDLQLKRATLCIQKWWIIRKRQLHMKRNPEAVQKIRALIMCAWRRRVLKKRHSRMSLIKSFLQESLILKDMVAKLYNYRKRVIRIQRWIRSYITIRNARLLALSLFITREQNIIKAEMKEKKRKTEIRMRRELAHASGFGATMVKMDCMTKRIQDVLEEEHEKSVKRGLRDSEGRPVRRSNSMGAIPGTSSAGYGSLMVSAEASTTDEAPAARRPKRPTTAHPSKLPSVMAPVNLFDAVVSLANVGNSTCAPSIAAKGLAADKVEELMAKVTRRERVKARFPTPENFIYRLRCSQIGCQQLGHYCRILALLRRFHVASFESSERRRMQSRDCVHVENVQQFLKISNPMQSVTFQRKMHRTASTRTMTGSVDVVALAAAQAARSVEAAEGNALLKFQAETRIAKLKSKKQKAKEAKENAYDDAKLLGEIVHSNATLFKTQFMMLTGAKQMLMDEIRALPQNLFL